MSYLKLLTLTIVGWAFGSFCYKIANDKIHPIVVEVIVTASYVVMIPVLLLFFKPTWELNSSGIIYSILGAIGMCVGSLAYFYLLKNGGQVGQITAASSLYPALTFLLSYLFLNEPLSLKKCLGFGLACCSMYLISSK